MFCQKRVLTHEETSLHLRREAFVVASTCILRVDVEIELLGLHLLIIVIERFRVLLRSSPACTNLLVGCVVRNAFVELELLGAATIADLVD